MAIIERTSYDIRYHGFVT